MKILKKTKSGPSVKDVEKENSIKELSRQLEAAGYRVRREKLKQGPGWKTMSGTCRLAVEKLIFVDRKNPIEDQLLFLQGIASQVGIQPPACESR